LVTATIQPEPDALISPIELVEPTMQPVDETALQGPPAVVLAGVVVLVISSITAFGWIGLGYWHVWRLAEQLLDLDFPSRWTKACICLEERLAWARIKHYRYLRTVRRMPRGRGYIFSLYLLLYRWYISWVVPHKWLDDARMSDDVNRSYRSLTQRCVVSPKQLINSNVYLKQKLGQLPRQQRLISDSTLIQLHMRLKTYYSAPLRALLPVPRAKGGMAKGYGLLYKVLFRGYSDIFTSPLTENVNLRICRK